MYRYPRCRAFRARRRLPTALLPLLVAAALSLGFFRFLSGQLRPRIETMATSRAVNLISAAISQETDSALAAQALGYTDFVTMEYDDAGRLVSLSVDPAVSTAFRRRVVQGLTQRLEAIDPEELAIPLGSLTGLLLLSALGPSVRVRVQSVGDVIVAYENQFTAAGVNQTRHSVFLALDVTVYLLIPGEIIPVQVTDRVCVAETIIIGEVPDTYLNLQKGDD